MAQLTQAEILARVKKALNITGTYQDETLQLYIEEAQAYMKDAGVHTALISSTVCVGAICRGVSDLWNYGAGNASLSQYFMQRVTQLAMMSDEDISQEFYTLDEILVYVQNNLVFPPGVVVTNFSVYPDGAGVIKDGTITLSDETAIEMNRVVPELLALTSTGNDVVGQTIITVSPALTSGNHYRIKYQSGTSLVIPAITDDVSDWETWDGESVVTAPANNMLVVVECNHDNAIVKGGIVKVVGRLF